MLPMATIHPLRPRPANTVGIQSHALENLRFIRETMERAGSFTAVPGWGGVAMGVIALAAGILAGRQPGLPAQLRVWMAAGVLAALVGLAATWRKARRTRLDLSSAPARKFVLGFAPAVAAGGVLTAALYRYTAISLAPGVWLLLYGTAIVAGGAFSVRPVPLMGLCFMAAGGGALLSPASWANWYLTASFGGIHLVFGWLIARRYGG